MEEALPSQEVDEVLVPEIFVPEGSTSEFGSASYNGVLKAGKALFDIYLKNRTVDGKPAPISMCEEHRALITSQPLMDNFGVFTTVAVRKGSKKPYSHTTMEKYFNAAVCYVEGHFQMKFNDEWQKKLVVKIVRRILKVKITSGVEIAFKASAGRQLTAALSKKLFESNAVSDIEARSSFVVEFKSGGRTNEGQFALNTDIVWNREHGFADITWKEQKTGKISKIGLPDDASESHLSVYSALGHLRIVGNGDRHVAPG